MEIWILKLKLKRRLSKLLNMDTESINARLSEVENHSSKISIILEAFKNEKVFDNDLIDSVEESLSKLNSDIEMLRRTHRRKVLKKQ